MHLANENVVDFLGIENDTGYVVLTLVDDYNWEDEIRHLGLLQAKINRYFDFIESGEVYSQVREITGRDIAPTTPVKISVLAKYEPSDEGRRFFEHVASVANESGVAFAVKVLTSTPPVFSSGAI